MSDIYDLEIYKNGNYGMAIPYKIIKCQRIMSTDKIPQL